MSNEMYPTARQKFGEADIHWVSDTIKVALLSSAYVYSEADEFHADLTGIIATSTALASKTNVLGVFDAADLVITPVSGVIDVERFVIFKDTGVSATSPLLFYFDRNSSSVPIDVTPDGAGMIIRWSNATNKIARI